MVVYAALLFVRQNIESFGYILELLLGGFITRIDVRVMLPRKLTISLFYILSLRTTWNAKHSIVIFLAHLSVAKSQKPVAGSYSNHYRLKATGQRLFFIININKVRINHIIAA